MQQIVDEFVLGLAARGKFPVRSRFGQNHLDQHMGQPGGDALAVAQLADGDFAGLGVDLEWYAEGCWAALSDQAGKGAAYPILFCAGEYRLLIIQYADASPEQLGQALSQFLQVMGWACSRLAVRWAVLRTDQWIRRHWLFPLVPFTQRR